jgi:hypothetical protein
MIYWQSVNELMTWDMMIRTIGEGRKKRLFFDSTQNLDFLDSVDLRSGDLSNKHNFPCPVQPIAELVTETVDRMVKRVKDPL